MKIFSVKNNIKKMFVGAVLFTQIVASVISPLTTYASIHFPEKVTIEFDSNQKYKMVGNYADNSTFSTTDFALFAVYNNTRQPVFCIEPGVPINNSSTSGYTSNPLPEIANKARAKYISVLWKYAGTDADTQIVAQAMIWKEVNGVTITSITRPDGTNLNSYQSIQDKINKIVDDYIKKPSFSGETVKVNLGESITLTDTNNIGLDRFDGRFQNTANVDWSIKGNQLNITPKKDSNISGVLRIAKSLDTGTPVAYKLAGQQSVMAGAIDDPNSFNLNIEIVKVGEVKIIKLDKGTGKVVPNTEFKVEYAGKTQTVKTDANGIAVVKDIPHDSQVKVTETFVPNPYILDKNNTKEVVVKAGKVASVEFKNERATGKTTLTKQDATTESSKPLNPLYPLTGAKYGLFKEDGTLLKEYTLDEKLTATRDNLELGKYYWQETVAPIGYKLDQTKYEVDLTYKDQLTPVVIKNAKSNDDVIRMNFEAQKLVQNETNEMFKNGVEFTLLNKRTNETQVVTTATVAGKVGYLKFADFSIDDYEISETKGVEGYKTVDPIEITHSYDEETETFTFVVKDKKSGNVLNEIKITQKELSGSENVDLGAYVLKDKAVVNENPIVGISTKAHTGDGKTNTFVWGEEVKFYDDSILTHKNIEVGTKRAKEVKLHAVYTDKDGKTTTEVVWKSGLIDYKVTDKEMTERVIAEYDYRNDKKADQNTRWYFSEDGYNYDKEKPTKDTEHSSDGKDPGQDIKPVVKETPKKEVPKETPKQPEQQQTSFLPQTGEQLKKSLAVFGVVVLVGSMSLLYVRKKKSKETNGAEDK